MGGWSGCERSGLRVKLVIAGRQMQEERLKECEGVYCNAQRSSTRWREYATPDAAGSELLKQAMSRMNLSARAYDRILKVSRTIADLAGSEQVLAEHLMEAINYRNLDKEGWAG